MAVLSISDATAALFGFEIKLPRANHTDPLVTDEERN